MKVIADFDPYEKAVEAFLVEVHRVLREKKICVVGLPGGHSEDGMFRLFKTDDRIPWDKIQLFMVDERLVPLIDPQSNFAHARLLFIDELLVSERIREDQVHPFVMNEALAHSGTEEYWEELKPYGGFDIVLLGVGEDGHVASLFPHHQLLNQPGQFLFIHDAPKPPMSRMTASVSLLTSASAVFLLFIGEAKRQALRRFMDTEVTVQQLPAALFRTKNTYVVTNLESR